MLKAFRVGAVEIGVELGEFRVLDQACPAAFGIFGHEPAWVRAVLAMPPEFGAVEHLAEQAQHVIGGTRGGGHVAHDPRDFGARDVGDLELAKPGDDMGPDRGAVALDRVRLVMGYRISGQILVAKLANRRIFAGGALGQRWILAFPDFRQPFLGDRPGLLHGEFSKRTDGWLAPFTPDRPVLEHEGFASCWADLAEKAGR